MNLSFFDLFCSQGSQTYPTDLPVDVQKTRSFELIRKIFYELIIMKTIILLFAPAIPTIGSDIVSSVQSFDQRGFSTVQPPVSLAAAGHQSPHMSHLIQAYTQAQVLRLYTYIHDIHASRLACHQLTQYRQSVQPVTLLSKQTTINNKTK